MNEQSMTDEGGTVGTTRKGIDVVAAMEILAQRQQHQPQGGDNTTNNNEEGDHHQHYNHDDHHQTNQHAGGQVIGLFPTNPRSIESNPCSTTENHDELSSATRTTLTGSTAPASIGNQHQQQRPSNEKAAEKDDRWKSEISSMSSQQRIQLVFKAQEDRVLTYRKFDEYVLVRLLPLCLTVVFRLNGSEFFCFSALQ